MLPKGPTSTPLEPAPTPQPTPIWPRARSWSIGSTPPCWGRPCSRHESPGRAGMGSRRKTPEASRPGTRRAGTPPRGLGTGRSLPCTRPSPRPAGAGSPRAADPGARARRRRAGRGRSRWGWPRTLAGPIVGTNDRNNPAADHPLLNVRTDECQNPAVTCQNGRIGNDRPSESFP
jgi:hypothetical protein